MNTKSAFMIASPTYEGAEEILERLRKLEDKTDFDIHSVAIIQKDWGGDVHVDDQDNVEANEGTLAGAFAGTVVGALMAGVPGAVVGAGTGAVTGGFSATMINLNMNFDQAQLESIGESLQLGSSALIIIIDNDRAPTFERSVIDEFGNSIKSHYFDLRSEAVEEWNELKRNARNVVS